MTVSVPSLPLELNTKPRSGSNVAASGPLPIGTSATWLPELASVTTRMPFPQTENSRAWWTSIARPVGSSQCISGQAAIGLLWAESITPISDLSSML
jgi:hypothetical protein